MRTTWATWTSKSPERATVSPPVRWTSKSRGFPTTCWPRPWNRPNADVCTFWTKCWRPFPNRARITNRSCRVSSRFRFRANSLVRSSVRAEKSYRKCSGKPIPLSILRKSANLVSLISLLPIRPPLTRRWSASRPSPPCRKWARCTKDRSRASWNLAPSSRFSLERTV